MQRYEFDDGTSSKFWQVEQVGAELHVSWGKIGTAGQSQVKSFDDAAKATAARDKLIAEKTKKGYVAEGDVGAGGDAASLHQAGGAAVQPPDASDSPARQPAPRSQKAAQAPEVAAPAQAPASPDATVPGSAASTGLDGASGDAESVDAPAGDAEALAQRLAELRAAPAFETQVLTAWRAALGSIAQGELGLLAPKLATIAQLKKRFGLNEPGARLLVQWLEEFGKGDGLRRKNSYPQDYWTPQRLVPIAQALLADPRLAEREAQAAGAHAAQWADLPSAAQRDEARFARVATKPPMHLPVWPSDDEEQAMLASWREHVHGWEADDDLQPELDALRAHLSGSSPATFELDVLWLALGQFFNCPAEPVLLRRHGWAALVQRVMCALGRSMDTRWSNSRTVLCEGGSLRSVYRIDHLCYLRELLRQASAADRAACERLMLDGLAEVPVARRQHLAVLLPESQALAQAVLNSPDFDLAAHGDSLWASAVDEPLQEQLHASRRAWWANSVWVTELLDEAWLRRVASAGEPDTLAQDIREASAKPQMQALELAQARWPLAMLIAATRVAVSADRQAPAALGLVRGLLAELGAAHALARPWLTPAAWRWLQAQAQPQAKVALADAADLPPVLRDPPWLRKRAKGEAAQRAVLKLPVLPVADALNWTRVLTEPTPIAQTVAEPGKLAYALRVDQWSKDNAYIEEGAKAIAAGDAEALIAAWRKPLAEREGYGYNYMDGKDIGKLPTALAVPLWNAMASELTIYESEHVMDRWGDAALPGLLAHFERCPTCKNEYWARTGTTQQAQASARMAFRTRVPAQRQRGQHWLLAWPEHAAAALLPAALGPDGADQVDASQALRFLASRGQRDLLAQVAARHSQPEVLDALNAMLDQDPLDLYPPKLAKLPEFWQPRQWARPALKASASDQSEAATTGGALPDEAVNALGQMLSFPRPAGVYAGLAQVLAACTPDSLADFAWDLFSAWLAAGAQAKDSWAFSALGLLGNDHAVHRLTPLMRAWPSESQSSRASLGLLAMAELGTDSALRLVADLTDAKVPKGLRTKAQDLLAQAAEARGLSQDDLEDRLVPGLDLDARAQTVLDYGPRQFQLSLDENLKPFLRKLENGKPGARLKSLPAKNAGDDPDKAQHASERFKAIKVQAEGVAKVQIKRLEQAMVLGRRWRRADFEALYLQQPLLRQLASRLVWGVFEAASGAPDADAIKTSNPRDRAERLLQALRLSGDGELSTADDEAWAWSEAATPADMPSAGLAPTEVAPGGADADADAGPRLGIVHPMELSDAEREAFAQLLADYELMQPFEQLARQVHAVPPAQREARVSALASHSYSPGRLLALKTRGWTQVNYGGYQVDGAERTFGGMQVALRVSPGVDAYEVRNAPPQKLEELSLRVNGKAVSWATLDTLSFSEVLREMAYLAL